MKISKFRKLALSALAVLSATTISVATFAACGNGSGGNELPEVSGDVAGAAEGIGNGTLNYIRTKYGVEADHVFDVVTVDRLVQAVEEEGKSVIVFADAESEVAKAAIPAINNKAKELGISKIYYFDPILAGEYGVNIWDNPEEYWPDATTADGSNVTQIFVGAGNAIKHNLLGDSIESFTASNDTLLFVTDNGEVEAHTVVTSKDDLKASEVEATLSKVIVNGQSIATELTDFDYFARWNKSNYFATKNYSLDRYKDNFKLRSITYYELRLLLETPGEHNFLASGSWCGDSQAAIPWIAALSSASDSDPVYVFDFRLTNNWLNTYRYDGVTTTDRWSSVVEVEGPQAVVGGTASRNTITRVGHLGKAVMDKFGAFPTGVANTELRYTTDLTVDGSTATASFETTTGQKKFRSPYLAKYDKDKGGIQKAWLHEVEEWEEQHSSNYPAGTLVDNELSSGELSAQQKVQSEYDLALFFGYADVKYNPTTNPNISETDSELDSGCGDDNDPIDNLGQSTLIPNHGTTDYDVEKYDIDVTLNPTAVAANSTFTAKTTITATAAKQLVTISLDFRKIEIQSIKVDGVAVTNYSQDNNDAQDLQKLNITPSSAIADGAQFTVEVEYTLHTIDYAVAHSNTTAIQGFNVHTDGKGYTAIGEPFGATYWFPNNNTPADGANFKVTLHAPEEYTLISSGKRTSDSTSGGVRTTVWEVTQDTATYQIFATFSKNITELTSYKYNNIDIRAYVNTDILEANASKVLYYYSRLPLYIKTLEDKFGAYPGESLGFVIEDVGDGNGGSASWGAIETKDRPFYTSAGVIGENTFVHELTHQWFGDAVRTDSWENLWLNEGFATFGSDLFYEEYLGSETFNTYEKWYNVWNTHGATSQLWVQGGAAEIAKESDLFGGAKVAYNRGAMALAVLRHDLGDTTFFDILQTWISDNQGSAKTTADFIALVKQKSGKTTEIDSFAEVWLYGTEKPAAFTLTGAAA